MAAGDCGFRKSDPKWADITPLPQDDGSVNVVRIAYTDEFREVHDYLRALLQKDERSERALELVTKAIDLNPANYTSWHYRRVLLQDLKKDLRDELRYISEVILERTKNYQVWHHRRCIVQWLSDASQELEFTDEILSEDAKNYHAWEHRQWAIRQYNLWSEELDYTDRLLYDDIRNNSAWNQRYFVIANTTKFTPEVVDREFEYTKQKIELAFKNESAWNYLRGIFLGRKMSAYPALISFLESLVEKGVKSPYLYSLLVDLCEERMVDKVDKEQNLKKAIELLKQLKELDAVRKEYWNYLSQSLSLKFGEFVIEGQAP